MEAKPTLESLVAEYKKACEDYADAPIGDPPVPEPDPEQVDDDRLSRIISSDRKDLRDMSERFKGILNRPPYCYGLNFHSDLELRPFLSLNPYEYKMTRVSFHRYHNLIRSPQFKRILRIAQLTHVQHAFNGANHTRGEHSMMASYFAGKIADALGLGDYEKRLVEVDGLLHDIGHPPWGHCAENLLRKDGFDHEKEGMRICEQELARHIEAHVRLEDILAMFRGDHPLAQVVSGAFGSDRIAYLLRDLELTRTLEKEPYSLFRLDPGQLISNMVLAKQDGQTVLAIKSDAIDLAADFLRLRAIAYNKIYHNPNVQIIQRFAHKVLEASGLASSGMLPGLDDPQLEDLLTHHHDERVAEMYHRRLDLGRITMTSLAMKIYTRMGTVFYREPPGEPPEFAESAGNNFFRTRGRINDEYIRGIERDKAMTVCDALKSHDALLKAEEGIAWFLNREISQSPCDYCHNNRLVDKKDLDESVKTEEGMAGYVAAQSLAPSAFCEDCEARRDLTADDIAIVIPINLHKKKPEYAPILTKDGVKNLYDLRPSQRWSIDELLYNHWAIRITVPEPLRDVAVHLMRYHFPPEWLIAASKGIYEDPGKR
ncbi:MAG: HD domain-containing protein [Nanoarchaeota archaeon]